LVLNFTVLSMDKTVCCCYQIKVFDCYTLSVSYHYCVSTSVRGVMTCDLIKAYFAFSPPIYAYTDVFLQSALGDVISKHHDIVIFFVLYVKPSYNL
jgi:hypothetical protein